MLQLQNINKEYVAGDTKVAALKDISISFRKNEFVAILGPSGCGKTTLLNIIGGLDHYTSGDLIINGTSTKEYIDRDWDTYRNHEIGFVFQSYNLIPHLTVLGNVELALSLSGISRLERKKMATDALKKVGLTDQIKKYPNQLSGGQMQRVAIARAIVNNPNIILADEPTGALDTETSLQVMEVLKEIAKDRLVIMVTHNPDLAERYATRTIRLLDGEIIGDDQPYEIRNDTPKNVAKSNNSKMPFFTAVSLSLKNLLTKKGRTFLVSFAGSIGIIGIALVLSISNGFSNYIDDMQNDMLSGYPVTISKFAADYDAIENVTTGMKPDDGRFPDNENLYVYDPSSSMQQAVHLNMINQDYTDYIRAFYEEDQSREEEKRLLNAVQFSFASSMNIMAHHDDTYTFVQTSLSSSSNSMMDMLTMFMGSNSDVFQEALDNTQFIKSQYDVISGHYPENKNEVAIVVDQKNRISASVLSALGINYKDDQNNLIEKIAFEDLLYKDEMHPGVVFKVLSNDNYYFPLDANDDGVTDYYEPARYKKEVTDDLASFYNSIEYENHDMTLHIVGVLRLNESAPLDLFNSGILYLPELTTEYVEMCKASDISKVQMQDTNFLYGDYRDFYQQLGDKGQQTVVMLGGNEYKIPAFLMRSVYNQYINSEEGIPEEILDQYIYETAKQAIGASDVPTAIYLYPKSFKAKTTLNNYLDAWNETHDTIKIVYTDAASVFSTTLGTMVDIISYVLIAFSAISLVVSSIMIAILTYVSVIERTKEIGVLRALGARKIDIASVFNAETLLIGFISGLFGVFITYILCIPINLIIKGLAGPVLQMNLAVFNPLHALILMGVSIVLTMISGFIPSIMAAKKDPVVALRSE